MRPIIVSSGEPAGIGPDLCLDLINVEIPLVVAADQKILEERAKVLKKDILFLPYNEKNFEKKENALTVLNVNCPQRPILGQLNTINASYVLDILNRCIEGCQRKEFSALVTAPVHKGVINSAGIPFTGHTEYLARATNTEQVVMLLACPAMRVALVTTHIPLRAVPDSLSITSIISVIKQLNLQMQKNFSLASPQIYVAGLNPHAGESGYLGREELDIIAPALDQLRQEGISVHGPFAADTLFATYHDSADVFVAMYHDQGLTVLKYAGFGKAVNITLGLPFVRTSVDHGTALALAGTGMAQSSSLHFAIEQAFSLIQIRDKENGDH